MHISLIDDLTNTAYENSFSLSRTGKRFLVQAVACVLSVMFATSSTN